MGVVGRISMFFSGGSLSNHGVTSGMSRSSGKWDRGTVLFVHKEWIDMITCPQRSLGNYPRSEGGSMLEWERLIF